MLASRIYSKAVTSLIIILLVGSIRSAAQDWRGIVPLRSTRADVERLLGPPLADRGSIAFYHLKQEKVSFSYAEGPCGVGSSLWNVPRDTVTHIRVIPDQISLADLKLDESKYEKKRNEHIQRVIHFINEDEGVSYNIDTRAGDKVTAIEYYPSATDNHLRCSSPGESLNDVTKFDSYSDMTFDSERKRLDSFTEQLRRHGSAIGYIMVYAGRRARQGEAAQRAERAKKYLVREGGVDARRVVTIDAGYREDLTVELYLVPLGATPPLPTPTVEPSEVQIIKAGGAKNNSRRASRSLW